MTEPSAATSLTVSERIHAEFVRRRIVREHKKAKRKARALTAIPGSVQIERWRTRRKLNIAKHKLKRDEQFAASVDGMTGLTTEERATSHSHAVNRLAMSRASVTMLMEMLE